MGLVSTDALRTIIEELLRASEGLAANFVLNSTPA
jgi:hypothetical protein